MKTCALGDTRLRPFTHRQFRIFLSAKRVVDPSLRCAYRARLVATPLSVFVCGSSEGLTTRVGEIIPWRDGCSVCEREEVFILP